MTEPEQSNSEPIPDEEFLCSAEEARQVRSEQSDFRMPTGDLHRVLVEFDQGTYVKRLIHPEGGCATADRCGQCGLSFLDREPEDKPCYDCPDDPASASEECWVQGWFDNEGSDLLHGTVELVVKPIFEFDHCELHVVGVPAPEKGGTRS